MNNIHPILDNNKGYEIKKLTNNEEFIGIKTLVKESFNRNLLNHKIIDENEYLNIEEYHNLNISNDIHKKIWTRNIRRADKKLTAHILNSNFYLNLEKIFGPLEFTRMVDDNLFDIFWRLVRPNKKNDVGSIHADSWFWKANNTIIPKGKKCLKLWMMLSEDSGPGLGIVPFSQIKKNWIYKIEFKDGLNKPVFDQEQNNYKILPMKTNNSEFILFHYDLLHSGLINYSNNTRCSLEMTFFYNI